MIFSLTEEQKILKKVTRDICKKYGDEYWRDIEKSRRFPIEFWNECAIAGLIGVLIPEKYGGSELEITDAVIILMEIAKSAAGMDGASTIHLSMFGVNPLFYHGNKNQLEKYLPDVANGKLHVCFAITEPNAGTDTTRTTTFAEKEGNKYIINGHKVFITKAQNSTRMLLLTRTTPLNKVKKKTDGMSLFFIPVDSPSITIKEIEKMGRNGIDTNEIFIENLEVDKSDLIGEEGKGFYYLLDGLNPERMLIAAEAVGMGYGAIERASDYAKERIVFGSPIGKNQGVQFPLSDSYSQLKAAEMLIYYACWLFEEKKPCGAEANMAKLRGSEAGFNAVDAAFQVFGGYGYAKEYNIERIYRMARLPRIAPVTNELIKSFIAEKVLGLPKSY